MIWTIARAAQRGLLGRRRTLLVVIVAAIPVLIAAIVRASADTSDAVPLTAGLLDGLVVRTVLPLVALVLGTAVLGSDLEDGTAVYLLAKPIERWRIVAATYLVAALPTAGLMALVTLAAGLVVGGGRGAEGVSAAFAVAVAVGGLLYVAVFLALSIVTSRALVLGLGYVLIWEGLLGGLLEGTAVVSIRQYVLAIAKALAGPGGDSITVTLGSAAAVGLSVILLAAALVLATRRLARYQVRGGD